MDILARLAQFKDARGWSEYRMAQVCGLSENTIANIFRGNNLPSLPTLQAICDGFGISLSQFFTEEKLIEETPELKLLLDEWVTLTPKQKESVLQICRSMNDP